MSTEIIRDGETRLAIYYPASADKKGLSFITEDKDLIQAGCWSYGRGTRLQPHIHNLMPRQATKTQEALLIKSGRLAAYIFNEDLKLIRRLELGAGDLLVLLNGGHGYEILEDDTLVFEFKNGPYPGAEADRSRFQWPKI